MRIVMIANPIISEYQLSALLEDKHLAGDILACNQMNVSLDLIQKMKADLVIAYVESDNDLSGLTDVLKLLKAEKPDLYVLIMLDHDMMGHLDERLQEVADDFISVPLETEELAARLRIAERYVELLKRLAKTQTIGAVTSPEIAPPQPMSVVEARDQTQSDQESDPDSTYQSYDPRELSDQPSSGSGSVTTASPTADIPSFLPDTADSEEIAAPDPNAEKSAAQQASEALQAFLEKQKLESEQAEEIGEPSSARSRIPWLTRNKKLLIDFISLLILLIMSSVAFLAQCDTTGKIPSFYGYQIYVCFSNDMSATFDKGSVVLVRYVRPQEIRVGDIITYTDASAGSIPISQRVVKIDVAQGLSFTTRGDNNEVENYNPVPAERVIGKVYNSTANLGYFMSFAQSKRGIIALIFIPALVLIPLEVRNIYKLVKKP